LTKTVYVHLMHEMNCIWSH